MNFGDLKHELESRRPKRWLPTKP